MNLKLFNSININVILVLLTIITPIYLYGNVPTPASFESLSPEEKKLYKEEFQKYAPTIADSLKGFLTSDAANKAEFADIMGVSVEELTAEIQASLDQIIQEAEELGISISKEDNAYEDLDLSTATFPSSPAPSVPSAAQAHEDNNKKDNKNNALQTMLENNAVLLTRLLQKMTHPVIALSLEAYKKNITDTIYYTRAIASSNHYEALNEPTHKELLNCLKKLEEFLSKEVDAIPTPEDIENIIEKNIYTRYGIKQKAILADIEKIYKNLIKSIEEEKTSIKNSDLKDTRKEIMLQALSSREDEIESDFEILRDEKQRNALDDSIKREMSNKKKLDKKLEEILSSVERECNEIFNKKNIVLLLEKLMETILPNMLKTFKEKTAAETDAANKNSRFSNVQVHTPATTENIYRSDRYNDYDSDTDNNSDSWQGMGSSSNSPKNSSNEDQKKSDKQSNTSGKGGSSKNNVKKKQASDAAKVDPKKTDGYNIEEDDEEKTGNPEYDQANEKLVKDIKNLNKDIQDGLTEIKKSETKKDKKVEKSKEALSNIAKDVNEINDDMQKIKEQKLPAEKTL